MTKCDTIFGVVSGGETKTLGLQSGCYLLLPGGVTEVPVYDPDAKLRLLKEHVRADDFADDDEYLRGLLDTAEEYVCRITNRSTEELVEMGGGDIPQPLWQAELLICGHWYNQREAVSHGQMTEVPYTLSALIKPYVKLV